MANSIAARKNSNFKAISTAPSINKTPVGSSIPPLPYPVFQTLDSSLGIVPTVRLNGDSAYVLNQSTQPTCIGDAAGSVGGIKSGTVSGEVKPVQGSSTVRMGGQPIIRDGDPCTLNSGNCPGVYLTSQTGAGSLDHVTDTNPPIQPETKEEKSLWSTGAHLVLGGASLIPFLSVVTSGADALLYLAEGDKAGAAMSGVGMIPGAKLAIVAGKGIAMAKAAAATGKTVAILGTVAKEGHVATEVVQAAKLAEEAEKAAKLAKEAEEAKKAKDGTTIVGQDKLVNVEAKIEMSSLTLQKKFKHANDFGVTGNYSPANAAKFGRAIEKHVADSATQVIRGTYRGQPVTHYFNPQTGLNVIKDPAGKLVSGWKLTPAQIKYMPNLGGG